MGRPSKEKRRQQQAILVCARGDSPFMVEGSVFDKICTRCARPVMVAPSGARYLIDHPHTQIVCLSCVDLASVRRVGAAASQAEVVREIRTAQPNPRSGSAGLN